MREVFYFIWWVYEAHKPIFYLVCLVAVIIEVLLLAVCYRCGQLNQEKKDHDTIQKLEEENSLGINTSERVATQYDVISGNYVEDDPIYN